MPSAPGPTASPSTALRDQPHGVDLGALEPRLPEVLRTPDAGRSSWSPSPSWPTCPACRRPSTADPDALRLVGRRDLRSNNSWMHNVEVLVKGRERCTLHVHPDDAARLGLTDGAHRRGAVPGRSGSRPRSRSPTPCAPGW